MGWYVLDTQVFDKNKFYTYETYREICDKKMDKFFKNEKRKNKIKKFFQRMEEILK